jgi:hypothetical protein
VEGASVAAGASVEDDGASVAAGVLQAASAKETMSKRLNSV